MSISIYSRSGNGVIHTYDSNDLRTDRVLTDLFLQFKSNKIFRHRQMPLHLLLLQVVLVTALVPHLRLGNTKLQSRRLFLSSVEADTYKIESTSEGVHSVSFDVAGKLFKFETGKIGDILIFVNYSSA